MTTTVMHEYRCDLCNGTTLLTIHGGELTGCTCEYTPDHDEHIHVSAIEGDQRTPIGTYADMVYGDAQAHRVEGTYVWQRDSPQNPKFARVLPTAPDGCTYAHEGPGGSWWVIIPPNPHPEHLAGLVWNRQPWRMPRKTSAFSVHPPPPKSNGRMCCYTVHSEPHRWYCQRDKR